MLKILRKKKIQKTVWIIVSVIVIIAFVFGGYITRTMRDKNEPNQISKILGHSVSPLEFRDAVNAVRVQAVMQFGEKYNEALKYLNFEDQAMDRLYLLYAAKRRHLNATDKEVTELIESYPFFQSKDIFDNRIYAEVLQYVFHVQARVFEEQTRQNIIIAKLYKQITKDVLLTDAQARDEYVKLNQKLSVDYIASIPAEFAKELKYTEADLKDYFSKNSLDFKQPLSFNLEYITLDSLDNIKDLKGSLDKKGVFEKIAKDNNLTINETGLFGQDEAIPQLGWSAEGTNIISKLKIGQCAPPIQADKKFYILRLKDKKEPFIPEFEKIQDKVKDAMVKVYSDKTAKEKITQALNNLRVDNNFPKTAKLGGIKYGTTGLFQFGTYLEGIGASDALWLAANKLKTGEYSPVITMPIGYYIVKLKSVSPVDEKKFDDEKTDFSLKLLMQKKQDAFDKFLAGLKNNNQ
ncbi:MAG: peptidylprolyl isomerase [Candidatus Omnitrophica bacterium]|nr:peptidylprolyl isomerase [Candidatus Omnitrophota bacterium]